MPVMDAVVAMFLSYEWEDNKSKWSHYQGEFLFVGIPYIFTKNTFKELLTCLLWIIAPRL